MFMARLFFSKQFRDSVPLSCGTHRLSSSQTKAKLLRMLQPVTGEGLSIRYICRLGENKD